MLRDEASDYLFCQSRALRWGLTRSKMNPGVRGCPASFSMPMSLKVEVRCLDCGMRMLRDPDTVLHPGASQAQARGGAADAPTLPRLR